MRMKGNRGHNRSKKSKRQRYAIREMHEVTTPRLRKTIKALLPNRGRKALAMPRVKGGPRNRRRHKRVLAATKGHRGQAPPDSFAGRTSRAAARAGLRQARPDALARAISADCGSSASTLRRARRGLSYSSLMHGLRRARVEVDSEDAGGPRRARAPKVFSTIVAQAKAGLRRGRLGVADGGAEFPLQPFADALTCLGDIAVRERPVRCAIVESRTPATSCPRGSGHRDRGRIARRARRAESGR